MLETVLGIFALAILAALYLGAFAVYVCGVIAMAVALGAVVIAIQFMRRPIKLSEEGARDGR